jgi:hypothetical protein
MGIIRRMQMSNFMQWLINSWRFRQELSRYRNFDRDLGLFARAIELHKIYIEKHGHQADESRLPKISVITRAVYLLRKFNTDNILDIAEQQLGYEYDAYNFRFVENEGSPETYRMVTIDATIEEKNKALSERSRLLEKELWRELWDIVHGDEKIKGSGILGWWD